MPEGTPTRIPSARCPVFDVYGAYPVSICTSEIWVCTLHSNTRPYAIGSCISPKVTASNVLSMTCLSVVGNAERAITVDPMYPPGNPSVPATETFSFVFKSHVVCTTGACALKYQPSII